MSLQSRSLYPLRNAHRPPPSFRTIKPWSWRPHAVTAGGIRLSSHRTTKVYPDRYTSTFAAPSVLQIRNSSSSPGTRNALRVLFCGADAFSIYSLKALHDLHLAQPDTIVSIDVVCRPDKRVGPGLKQVREAFELDLPLHQIDTFTGWSPPHDIDLIVTVSFGLLVPARLLKAATYGGVNVHPSLLPDLRGPAPIHHALLHGREYTGVSLQTMHPTAFDAGVVLAQTPAPGTPIAGDATIAELVASLGQAGADMLTAVIVDRTYAPPYQAIASIDLAGTPLQHAPKITPEDRRIDWSTWTSETILRRDRVLGRLWDSTTVLRLHAATDQNALSSPGTKARRITFTGPWSRCESAVGQTDALRPGQPILLTDSKNEATGGTTIGMTCVDGQVLAPQSATIEGRRAHQGLPMLRKLLLASREKSQGTTEDT
ncbi:Methionyl-tRNA formyltransferase [Oleoguttula sp. CCFEE 5521]